MFSTEIYASIAYMSTTFTTYSLVLSRKPIGGQHRRLTLVTRKRISKLHPHTALPFYACELQAIPSFGARSMLGVSLPH